MVDTEALPNKVFQIPKAGKRIRHLPGGTRRADQVHVRHGFNRKSTGVRASSTLRSPKVRDKQEGKRKTREKQDHHIIKSPTNHTKSKGKQARNNYSSLSSGDIGLMLLTLSILTPQKCLF